MALNFAQFRARVQADSNRLKDGKAPQGVDTCYQCSIPLQESITGNRAVKVDGVQKHACSDCYFEEIGKEIDDFPIFMPRVRRG